MESSLRIAIVGAGPIGLEAALYALELGHDVTIYEREDLADHVRRWGFVELFSPWSMNTSNLGLRVLMHRGVSLPDPDTYPTGHALRGEYLLPISRHLEGNIRTRHRVLKIGRAGWLKGESLGSSARSTSSFRLLVRDDSAGVYPGTSTGDSSAETGGRERYDLADVVIDASGVFGQPNDLGPGGLPLPRQASADSRIQFRIPDILGAERELFAGKRTLLVGGGYSAATALRDFCRLREESPDTEVIWARRGNQDDGLQPIPDDPLPQRKNLALFVRSAIDASVPPLKYLSGVQIDGIDATSNEKLSVTLGGKSGKLDTVQCDRILALVGFRPDTDLFRELQVHLCYASEGPMKLAAALLGSKTSGDCMAPNNFGPSILENPESRFFVLGSKSYGRRSDFLLRTGREQIRDVFRLLQGDGTLDLYSEAK